MENFITTVSFILVGCFLFKTIIFALKDRLLCIKKTKLVRYFRNNYDIKPIYIKLSFLWLIVYYYDFFKSVFTIR